LRPRSAVVLILFIIGSLSLSGQPARAAGNLRLGPFKIRPSLALTEMIDSNVCRSDGADCLVDGEVEDGGDSVTLISPGVRVVLPIRRHDLEVEYNGEIARYGSLTSEDYENHTVRAGFHFDSPMGFTASAEDRFRHAHDPRGESQNLELDIFNENTASVTAGQALGSKLSVQAAFRYMTIHYDDSRNDFRDRKEGTAGGTVFYRFFPKTSGLVEVRWTGVSYDKDVEPMSRDSTVVNVLTGVSYEITAKSKGVLKAGLENRNFKDGDRNDYTGLALSMDVEHELTPKTFLKARAERRSNESYLSAQDYNVRTGFALLADHRFTDKITADAAVSYARETYPSDQTIDIQTDKRKDNTFKGGIGVKYWILRWINVGAKIDFENRNSNFSVYDYKDQRYAFTVALVL
jgi:hypothetical protein